MGCVAQQADVVRIKRELDAKISQLDKSKTSLQQAVTDANTALDKANSLIARQREEIKELLHARAEVMDQVATLKDTDLSQVRGAIEQNQHLVGELDQKFVMLDTKVQTVETKVQQSNEAMEPLVKELRMQLRAEEQLRTEQGGKIGEFRTSLVDYQQVLTALRQSVVSTGTTGYQRYNNMWIGWGNNMKRKINKSKQTLKMFDNISNLSSGRWTRSVPHLVDG